MGGSMASTVARATVLLFFKKKRGKEKKEN